MTIMERFWAKVDKSAGENGCWMWTACKQRGYGIFTPTRDRAVKAHRFLYEATVGPIPSPQSDYRLEHKGGSQPGCVNPAHHHLVLQPPKTHIETPNINPKKAHFPKLTQKIRADNAAARRFREIGQSVPVVPSEEDHLRIAREANRLHDRRNAGHKGATKR